PSALTLAVCNSQGSRTSSTMAGRAPPACAWNQAGRSAGRTWAIINAPGISEMELGRLGEIGQPRRVRIPRLRRGVGSVAGAGDDRGAHHRIEADDRGEPAADLELFQQGRGHF